MFASLRFVRLHTSRPIDSEFRKGSHKFIWIWERSHPCHFGRGSKILFASGLEVKERKLRWGLSWKVMYSILSYVQYSWRYHWRPGRPLLVCFEMYSRCSLDAFLDSRPIFLRGIQRTFRSYFKTHQSGLPRPSVILPWILNVAKNWVQNLSR